MPLTEQEHKTWSALKSLLIYRHQGLLGHPRYPPPVVPGQFPGAPQVGGKTPLPSPPQPRAAGRTLPCLLGRFLVGWLVFALGFFFPLLPEQPEKGSFGRCVAPSPPLPPPAPPPSAAERGYQAGFGMAVDWFGFGYAALVTSGGLIGYVKAGSVPSLAAGLFFGGLAGLGAYQLSQNPNNIWLSLITSGTLSAIMGTRFYNSRKFMPAGLIAGVSLLMVGRLALKMLEKPQDK
ncbi:uncharacterized protein LOC113964278 [Neopelma chrysocephalum]|nr:uncharacterized protein LOC113964278 [Neopelma chrysocephalum]